MTAFNFAERVDDNTIFLMAGLLLAIFIPSSMFFAYQIYKRKTNITISKRYPVISFCYAIFFVLRLIVASINLLMLKLDKYSINDIGYKLCLFFDNIFLYLFLIFLMWRLWNINCDFQWINKSIQDEQWRTMISTDDAYGHGNGMCNVYIIFIYILLDLNSMCIIRYIMVFKT